MSKQRKDINSVLASAVKSGINDEKPFQQIIGKAPVKAEKRPLNYKSITDRGFKTMVVPKEFHTKIRMKTFEDNEKVWVFVCKALVKAYPETFGDINLDELSKKYD